MARGKKRSSSSTVNSAGRRDHFFSPSRSIAKFDLPVLQTSLFVPYPESPFDLRSAEDRRSFHFEGPDRPALMDDGVPARTHVVDRQKPRNVNRVKPRAHRFGPKFYSQTKALLAFKEPERVVVCIRRQRRKEVLFAIKKAGRGGMKRPRRTWLSSISCRR